MLVWLWSIVGWEDESTSCITLSNDCLDHGCLNGATCVDDVRTYTCLCPPGYTGNVVIVMLVVVVSIIIIIIIVITTTTFTPLSFSLKS